MTPPCCPAFAVALGGGGGSGDSGEGLTSRDRCSLVRPAEVRAELLWLWGPGDTESTSLTLR